MVNSLPIEVNINPPPLWGKSYLAPITTTDIIIIPHNIEAKHTPKNNPLIVLNHSMYLSVPLFGSSKIRSSLFHLLRSRPPLRSCRDLISGQYAGIEYLLRSAPVRLPPLSSRWSSVLRLHMVFHSSLGSSQQLQLTLTVKQLLLIVNNINTVNSQH